MVDVTRAIEISDMLMVNTSLTSLYLNDCRIDDAGATALAAALTVNSTLKVLVLQGNPQTVLGEAIRRD